VFLAPWDEPLYRVNEIVKLTQMLDGSQAPTLYWMHETTCILRPVIEAYLHGRPMTPEQIATMRAYLRQWIMAPGWAAGPIIEHLRGMVDFLTTREEIDRWMGIAMDEGIDPL
jgi:hypothetical protein